MTIEDLIKGQIEQLDIKELVQSEIRRLVSDDVKREISKATKEEVQRIIKVEVEIQMSKGIKTDDGWGKKENFNSFEDMFKKHFSELLNSKYEIQRVVKDHITTETKKLVESKTKEIVKALSDSLGGQDSKLLGF
jgi:dihydroneopterin aldolase